MVLLDLLAVQGTLKSLLQYHSWKASIPQHSAYCIVQLSHPYMTTGKTIALTRWTFVSKVMSLLFNMLPKLVTAFLPRSKHLLISWLQSPYDPAISLLAIHPDKAIIWKDTCNILKECVRTSCISDRWLLPSHLRYQIYFHILPAICRPLVHTRCNHILS